MRVDNKEYYQDFSKVYEDNRRGGYHRFVDDLESACVLSFLNSNSRVLEVGCGTGLIMERLRTRTEHVKGVDLTPGMVDVARAKGLDAQVANACELPFKDNTFDVTCSFKVLAHVEEIYTAMRELMRVTKPGGHVIAEFYNRSSLRWLRFRLRTALSLKNKKRRFDESVIFTRYDQKYEMLACLPQNLQLIDTCGIGIWTPAAFFMKIPLISELLQWIERKSARGPLARFGGFFVMALRKK